MITLMCPHKIAQAVTCLSMIIDIGRAIAEIASKICLGCCLVVLECLTTHILLIIRKTVGMATETDSNNQYNTAPATRRLLWWFE